MEKETYTLEQLLQDYKDGYIRTFEELERAVMLLKGAGRNAGLNDLAADIHANAVAHGWWDEARSFGDIVALCHSELSEALEAYRDGEELVHGCCGHCTFDGSCDHPAPRRGDGLQAGGRGRGDDRLHHPHPGLVREDGRGCGRGAGHEARLQQGPPLPARGEGAVKIGQKVQRYPETFFEREGEKNAPKRPITGTVVYIHPLGRFHIVEFDLRGGKVQESFQGIQD